MAPNHTETESNQQPQAEFRVEIYEENHIRVKRRKNDDVSESVELRLDRLDDGIQSALDDLKLLSGGMLEGEEMDHVEIYRDEDPKMI